MREFGSEYSGIFLPDGYFATFEKFGHCTWLRSGREALHLAALTEKPPGDAPLVLLPAYCCESMVDPFEKAGWEVDFYPLNADLTADLDSLRHLLALRGPAAVLTMNFFGSSSTWETVSCIRRISGTCLIVEDFSHCTFSFASVFNPAVDCYVSSIRKSVGVCDGAVLVSRRLPDVSFLLDEETDFVRVRKDSQKRKALYSYSKNPGQKAIFYPQLCLQEEMLEHFTGVHRISETGMAMLKTLNGEQIRYARQKNMAHLLASLQDRVRTIPGIGKCLGGAPFSMPILVDDRDAVQKRLADQGVYAPVLWPIRDAARRVCAVSAEMADTMLSLPIDQRYTFDDVEDIARIILETCCRP